MSPEMWEKTQLYEITALITTKPRISDAGLYSLSNRLGKGLHSWLAPRVGLESRLWRYRPQSRRRRDLGLASATDPDLAEIGLCRVF